MAKKKRLKFTRRNLLVSLLLLGIAMVILAEFLIHKTPKQKTINVAPSSATVSHSSGSSSFKQTPSSGGYSSAGTSSKTSTTQSNTGQAPLMPQGQFVSNHSPGQHGTPTTETSVCTTTPGASCYIKFTKGSQVRTLTSGTADSNGNVYWQSWDVYKDADLTAGQWQITAVATLNNQSSSSTDVTPLTIQ